jgi:hypothetical protein
MAQETSGRVKSAPVTPDADFYSLDCDSPSDLYWASNGLPVCCSLKAKAHQRGLSTSGGTSGWAVYLVFVQLDVSVHRISLVG